MIRAAPCSAAKAVAPAPARICGAGADDLDAVMAIMTTAFPPDFGEAWTRSQCAGILPMAGVVLRLAHAGDGSPAGFALTRVVADEAELLLIAVTPAARRRGVGQALIADCIALAAAAGATRLHLEVRECNPAIALYQRAGFERAGRRRGYYHGKGGERRDALTLALTLGRQSRA